MLAVNSMLYRALAKGLLFRLGAETAYHTAAAVLRQHWLWRSLAPLLTVRDPALRTELAGLPLRSPVGVAAGYDKDCEMLSSLAALGFGYVTGGTVTLDHHQGNQSPRLLRYVEDESLINSMGFPSKGVDYAVSRLRRDRSRLGDAPSVVSVSGVTPEDIVACHRTIEPHCDAVEVNISSPNTSGVRMFQHPTALTDLLARVNECRTKPLFVKLPPYPPSRNGDDAPRQRVLALARVCDHMGVDALTVANTRPEPDPRLAVGAGGVSGSVLFGDTLRMVADIRAEVGPRLAINACGGISTAEEAYDALGAGATTVQLLTGMVYRGPTIAREINSGLLKLKREAEGGSRRRCGPYSHDEHEQRQRQHYEPQYPARR